MMSGLSNFFVLRKAGDDSNRNQLAHLLYGGFVYASHGTGGFFENNRSSSLDLFVCHEKSGEGTAIKEKSVNLKSGYVADNSV